MFMILLIYVYYVDSSQKYTIQIIISLNIKIKLYKPMQPLEKTPVRIEAQIIIEPLKNKLYYMLPQTLPYHHNKYTHHNLNINKQNNNWTPIKYKSSQKISQRKSMKSFNTLKVNHNYTDYYLDCQKQDQNKNIKRGAKNAEGYFSQLGYHNAVDKMSKTNRGVATIDINDIFQNGTNNDTHDNKHRSQGRQITQLNFHQKKKQPIMLGFKLRTPREIIRSRKCSHRNSQSSWGKQSSNKITPTKRTINNLSNNKLINRQKLPPQFNFSSIVPDQADYQNNVKIPDRLSFGIINHQKPLQVRLITTKVKSRFVKQNKNNAKSLIKTLQK